MGLRCRLPRKPSPELTSTKSVLSLERSPSVDESSPERSSPPRCSERSSSEGSVGRLHSPVQKRELMYVCVSTDLHYVPKYNRYEKRYVVAIIIREEMEDLCDCVLLDTRTSPLTVRPLSVLRLEITLRSDNVDLSRRPFGQSFVSQLIARRRILTLRCAMPDSTFSE